MHGFDGVQVTIEGNQKKLWLGESKLYTDGLSGIKELAKDLEKHINSDYLRSEFLFLSWLYNNMKVSNKIITAFISVV